MSEYDVPNDIKREMILEAIKKHKYISPCPKCAAKGLFGSFTVEEFNGFRYVIFWYDTKDESTHLLNRKMEMCNV